MSFAPSAPSGPRPAVSTAVFAFETAAVVADGLLQETAAQLGMTVTRVGRRELEAVLPGAGNLARLSSTADAGLDALGGGWSGVALHPLHGRDVTRVRERAWEACTWARAHGHDWSLWSPRTRPGAAGDVPGAAVAAFVAGEGDVVTVLRPVAAGTDLAPTAVSATCDWQHPAFGFVRGADLLQYAGRHRTAVWARCTTAALCHRRTIGFGGDVTVRLPADLIGRGLAAAVTDVLVEAGAAGPALTVEVSDRDAVTWPVTASTLRELRALDVGVALTRYGTGRTPWVELARLPLTEIVVDETIGRQASRSGAARAFLGAVRALTGDLHIAAGVAGVDTPPAAAALSAVGYTRLRGKAIATTGGLR